MGVVLPRSAGFRSDFTRFTESGKALTLYFVEAKWQDILNRSVNYVGERVENCS
jgi:hypothetical protein